MPGRIDVYTNGQDPFYALVGDTTLVIHKGAEPPPEMPPAKVEVGTVFAPEPRPGTVVAMLMADVSFANLRDFIDEQRDQEQIEIYVPEGELDDGVDGTETLEARVANAAEQLGTSVNLRRVLPDESTGGGEDG